jgi:hypothetical protein
LSIPDFAPEPVEEGNNVRFGRSRAQVQRLRDFAVGFSGGDEVRDFGLSS